MDAQRDATERAALAESDVARTGAAVDAEGVARMALERLQCGRWPYTRVGDRALLVMRRPGESYESHESMGAHGRLCDGRAARLAIGGGGGAAAHRIQMDTHALHQRQPHVFDVADSALMHLRNDAQDQCIALAGAGTAESARLLARRLCASSRSGAPSRSGGGVQAKISLPLALDAVEAVLDAFGGVAGSSSSLSSSSRCSRYTELQFTAAGALVGVKTLAYGLEAQRVAGASSIGSDKETHPGAFNNFSVFHLLLAGAGPRTRARWALAPPAHFHFLRNSSHFTDAKPADSKVKNARSAHARSSDADGLNALRAQLIAAGVRPRLHPDILRLLAAILHLGNIAFTRSPDAHTQQPCLVKNPAQLATTANLLGVAPDHLVTALTLETRAVGRELCTIILDVDGAIRQRNNLAILLYSLLFNSIIDLINKNLSKNDLEWSNCISILDFHGIRDWAPGSRSVARLISNYAAERIHGATFTRLLHAPDALADAGAHPPHLLHTPINPAIDPLASNKAVISLLSTRFVGIIDMICHEALKRTDRYAATAAAPATDPSPLTHSSSTSASTTTLERIIQTHKDNPVFIPPSTQRKFFTIVHYSGPVQYDIDVIDASVVDEGSINISTDFVTLFCGSMDQPATQFGFIHTLFSKRSIDVDLHPKNRQTLLRARQSTVLARKPSTTRRRTMALRGAGGTAAAAAAAGSSSNMTLAGDVSFSGSSAAPGQQNPPLTDQPFGPDTTFMSPSILAAGTLPSSNRVSVMPAADTSSLLAQTRVSMNDLIESIEFANMWLVIHIQPVVQHGTDIIDFPQVVHQVKSLHVDVLANSISVVYVYGMLFETLIDRATDIPDTVKLVSRLDDDARNNPDCIRQTVLDILSAFGIASNLYLVGRDQVFFTEACARLLYTKLNHGTLFPSLCRDDELVGHDVPNGGITRNQYRQDYGDIDDDGEDEDEDDDDHSHFGNHDPRPVGYDHDPYTRLIADKPAQSISMSPLHDPYASRRPSATSIMTSSMSLHTAEDEQTDIVSMYDFTASANRPMEQRWRKDIEQGGGSGGGSNGSDRTAHDSIGTGSFGRHSAGTNGGYNGMRSDGPDSLKRGAAKQRKIGEQPGGHSPRPSPTLPGRRRNTVTRARCTWMCLTWTLTWWIPTPVISHLFRKHTPDTRTAWREKVALCIIIFSLCASMLFIIIGLGKIICPRQNVLSEGEISTFNTMSKPMVIAYGSYYDVKDVVQTHVSGSSPVVGAAAFMSTVLGRDVSGMFFPTLLPAKYCPGVQLPPGWDNLYQRDNQGTPTVWYSHMYTPAQPTVPNDYMEQILYMRRGRVARDAAWMSQFLASEPRHRLIIAWGNVYDISAYYDASNVGLLANSTGFFGANVKRIFDAYTQANLTMRDATMTLNQLQRPEFGGPAVFASVQQCMNNLFMVGVVDTRNDLRCIIPNYILLAASCVLVAVIGIKFVGALHLGNARVTPENHARYVICQIPCYTEDETSLRKTIDSITRTTYRDTHKLLFIVCDGMIIGAGNDRPTPRIVLDVLGVDPLADGCDPEPLSFLSLGVGSRQHNMAKVYSGWYHVDGHSAPFIVVIKVGAPTERVKPGNRGKRDSQLLLMRFLNRVHFNAAFCPLEIEMYRQIVDVVGVLPSAYEYVLMVDADTEIMPDSITHMVATMVSDARIMGLCGETQLSNEQSSWVTMIQVYEYYISHHLAKAFESLFGTVTCLPGCFCMYRVRSPQGRMAPLLVSPEVLADYSENTVSTLHMKNLLELGEDRYLTTLMLKHFPRMCTTFVPGAVCRTGAPDTWTVLLSQRRRWINSTVHNLFELVFLKQLCGFCCFSMRFVVFIDLFATFLQPASVIYVVYLIVVAITDPSTTVFPTISLILLATVYGLQAVVFLLKQEWQHVGWMVIYLIATPVFGVFVPLYAFWHFDDFSWGNTRMVAAMSGGNGTGTLDRRGGRSRGQLNAETAIADVFDPASIPLVKIPDGVTKPVSVSVSAGSVRSGWTPPTPHGHNGVIAAAAEPHGYPCNRIDDVVYPPPAAVSQYRS